MMFKSLKKHPEPDSGYQRLEDQIAWYDRKSGLAQRLYKGCKGVEVLCAAAIPICASSWPLPTAILGGAILAIETLQQINQWHHNWITYRSTCEALRHEKYTFIENVGPYDGLDQGQARKQLVDRTEALISTEHSKWIASQERAKQAKPKATEETKAE